MSTLNCHQTRALLMAWLDSELDAVTTVAISEHLSTCTACRQRFDAEQMLEAGVREELQQERMPEEVWGRLQARLAAEVRPRLLRRWAPLAAAALVLVSLALLLYDPAQKLDESSRVRRELLRSFASAHASSQGEFIAGAERVPAVLSEAGFGGLELPATGMADGHEVTLLGAHRFQVDGRPCAELRYECCGEGVSVFVMDGSSLPEAMAEEDSLSEAGVHVRTLRRGRLLLGVASVHATRLSRF